MINPMILMNDDKAFTQDQLAKMCMVFSKMSNHAKNQFICMMISHYPNKFTQLVDALGEEYEDHVGKA
jgi:hypothetical protein